LSVVLGILAISIQSFDAKADYHSIYLIILSWVLLIMSFMAGIFRIERKLLLTYVNIDSSSIPEHIKAFEKASRGESVIMKNEYDEYNEKEIEWELLVLKVKEDLSIKYKNMHKTHIEISYQIFKWSFLFAIITYSLFNVSNIINVPLSSELGIISVIPLIVWLTILRHKNTVKSLRPDDDI